MYDCLTVFGLYCIYISALASAQFTLAIKFLKQCQMEDIAKHAQEKKISCVCFFLHHFHSCLFFLILVSAFASPAGTQLEFFMGERGDQVINVAMTGHASGH